jgi:hypothetical protein
MIAAFANDALRVCAWLMHLMSRVDSCCWLVDMRSQRERSAAGYATTVLILAAMSYGAQAQSTHAAVCDDVAHHPEYHQLDFWLGTWSVYAGDRKVSDVKIERPEGGCALVETWSATGSAITANRKSASNGLIAYDSDTNLWEYFWVTGVIGMHLHFTASPAVDLVWSRTELTLDGRVKLQHLTITKQPDGNLRERGASSLDAGKTWETDYDLSWRRQRG